MTAARAKLLIKGLKRTQKGWATTLPEEAGTCLGKRIDVSVRSADRPEGGEPPLSKEEAALLESILLNLPKLAARVEKAWRDVDGDSALDEGGRLARPVIWISRDPESEDPPGFWTMVINIAGSDFGWHAEFVKTRFKQVWGGD